MKRIVAIYLFTMLSGIASAACEKSYTIHSPDRTIGITLTVGNRIAYEVRVDGRTVVAPTPVAMTLDDGTVWGGSAQPSRIRKGMVDTSFATPFYIKKRVADHYNCAQLTGKATPSRVEPTMMESPTDSFPRRTGRWLSLPKRRAPLFRRTGHVGYPMCGTATVLRSSLSGASSRLRSRTSIP